MIPEGWITNPFENICYFQEGPGLRRWQYTSDGFPFLNIRCIKEGSLDLSNVQYISVDEANKKYSHFFLNEGDIVLSSSGTLGRLAKVTKASLPLMLNTSIIRCRTKSENILSSSFLYHYLQGKEFQDQISEESQGSAQVNFGPTHLKKVYSILPPLPEQKKIAAILTSVDDTIERQEAQIEKLQSLKKAMMQELLTNGIGHTEFKDTPVGRIPKSWSLKPLQKLSIDGINNGEFKDPSKVGSGYRLINVFDLYQKFGLEYENLELLDVDQKAFNKKRVEYGDVFFTRSSLKLEGIAYCNVNLHNRDDLIYECHVMRVRPDRQFVEPEYLALFCRSDQARKFFMASAKHSTMTTIGQSDIAGLPVPIPSLDEQVKIINTIGSIRQSIGTKQDKLRSLQSLKKSLMQDLLSGKVRVNV
ncbi:hypothetical protein FE236_00540 [Mariprofundus erugo]|uniref:restriction endonuclease subunit S n=1 Tax=Mariprofundus erugo TaxID=2528639 RepID=UPI0010FF32B6|nr:restriction endonuclease subunit S [Mariprofundus erugo]TLS78282.1 hypothetical protein FE236_00540 [Mariprofundus erugo]